jgi:putative ABC transport system substrate-binding protein
MNQLPLVAIFVLTVCAGAAVAQPAERQYRLAILSPVGSAYTLLVQELAKRGFSEGANLTIDFRTGSPEELPRLAGEIVSAKPDAIVAVSTALGAAGKVTDRVPIIAFGPDPVALNFADSLAHPGRNVTGVTILADLDGKRLQLIDEAVPGRRIAVLLHPAAQGIDQTRQAIAASAKQMGAKPLVLEASKAVDYPAAFEAMRRAGVGSLVISANAWFFGDREVLGRLAEEAGLATVCEWGDMARSVCTMGYGPRRVDLYARLADIVAQVLRGSSPAKIPIEQPTTVELVINLKAAKALGLNIPQSLLARADEVIE